MLLALWAAALLALPGDAPHRIEGIEQIRQGRAPFCAAAAGLMGASRLGPVPALRAFVRTLPVSADGIAWLELADGLRAFGVDPYVVQLTSPDLRRLIQQDIPVIVAVTQGGLRHAVLVDGVDAAGVWVRDPALPAPVHWTHAVLKARWSASQAVVLPAKGGAHPRLGAWQAMDRRYRALEWALRAERHPTPSAEMRALYDMAVAADPAIAAIRYNRGRVRAALGEAAGACADFTRAMALATAPAVRAAAAQASASCPPQDHPHR